MQFVLVGSLALHSLRSKFIISAMRTFAGDDGAAGLRWLPAASGRGAQADRHMVDATAAADSCQQSFPFVEFQSLYVSATISRLQTCPIAMREKLF